MTGSHSEFCFSGATSVDEMLNAYKLAWREMPQLRWQRPAQVVMYSCVILFGFYPYLQGDYNFATFFWTCGGVGFAILIYCAFTFRKRVASLLTQRVVDNKIGICIVDQQGTRFTDNAATLDLKWKKFACYRNNDDIAVIYLHYPSVFLAFFRRSLDPPATWDEFSALLDANLQRR